MSVGQEGMLESLNMDYLQLSALIRDISENKMAYFIMNGLPHLFRSAVAFIRGAWICVWSSFHTLHKDRLRDDRGSCK